MAEKKDEVKLTEALGKLWALVSTYVSNALFGGPGNIPETLVFSGFAEKGAVQAEQKDESIKDPQPYGLIHGNLEAGRMVHGTGDHKARLYMDPRLTAADKLIPWMIHAACRVKFPPANETVKGKTRVRALTPDFKEALARFTLIVEKGSIRIDTERLRQAIADKVLGPALKQGALVERDGALYLAHSTDLSLIRKRAEAGPLGGVRAKIILQDDYTQSKADSTHKALFVLMAPIGTTLPFILDGSLNLGGRPFVMLNPLEPSQTGGLAKGEPLTQAAWDVIRQFKADTGKPSFVAEGDSEPDATVQSYINAEVEAKAQDQTETETEAEKQVEQVA